MKIQEDRMLSATSVLSHNLRKAFLHIPEKLAYKTTEIILRVNRPLCIECVDKRYYFTSGNCITDTTLNADMVIVSQNDIFETFQNMCNYSVYARQNEINQGFVTIKGGHRAGICGSAVVENGEIVNIKNITSINIRLAREIIGCSDYLVKNINPLEGLLLCGSPCSGKTTLIRDYARQLSYKYKVCVIDERNELSANVAGTFYNDIGMCDVFINYKKSSAINHSIRNMSPDIIVCDELSLLEDIQAVKQSLSCAVAFVSTIHANTMKDLKNREFIKELIDTDAFQKIVFLDSKNNPGQIREMVDLSKVKAVSNV